ERVFRGRGARPPLEVIVAYIDAYKGLFGVEPICRVLKDHDFKIAPSTYYAYRSRPPSTRSLSDARLLPIVAEVHRDNYGVYGVRKMWRALLRRGELIGRDQVARLMRLGRLRGATRAKRPKRGASPLQGVRAPDLVRRDWFRGAPDLVWVADFTHVRTREGWMYVAFLQDGFSRRILGFTVRSSMGAELVTSTLLQAVSVRRRTNPEFVGHGVIHHSDAGGQGGFKWSSQHLGCGGVGWASRGSRCLRFRLGRGGSGRRIGLYGRRCGHRAGRSRRVRCSVSSG